jgi:regulator of RNase E activity RraA
VRGALEDWVAVEAGDIVVSDEDGVIVVPQSLLTTVTDRIIQWAQVESDSRDAIRKGMPLLTALDKYGHL